MGMVAAGVGVLAESIAEAVAGRGGRDHVVENETQMTFLEVSHEVSNFKSMNQGSWRITTALFNIHA